jgi:hypothetical protein
VRARERACVRAHTRACAHACVRTRVRAHTRVCAHACVRACAAGPVASPADERRASDRPAAAGEAAGAPLARRTRACARASHLRTGAPSCTCSRSRCRSRSISLVSVCMCAHADVCVRASGVRYSVFFPVVIGDIQQAVLSLMDMRCLWRRHCRAHGQRMPTARCRA